MLLQPQQQQTPGLAGDSIMSMVSMYRYMFPTTTNDVAPPMDQVPGGARLPQAPPVAHAPHPGSSLTMPSSSHSVHALFNPQPHSPNRHNQQDNSRPPDIPPPFSHGPPPPTPVSQNPPHPGNTGGLVVPTPSTRTRTIKSYHCRMCDQIFDNKSDLLVHSQTVHKADPKPYRCPTCQKCFANSSYLSQHARIHAGIKPYKCQICERRFTQLCHLQQHIRTHTGEKPYKCQHPSCGKAFSQLSNLQSHSRSHMTDKPYRCNSCYKCFTDEQGLRDHIPKHSETKHLKTFICRICGKSYTQETYLARHMTKHQGVDPAANMLNLTALRHQQAQAAQQQQQQQQQQQSPGGGSGPPMPTSSSGLSSHSSSSLGSPTLANLGPPPNPQQQQQQQHQQHQQPTTPHPHHRPLQPGQPELPDIKPLLENNGFESGNPGDKPSSAFMPLAHQFHGPNMMNTSVPSNFAFPSPRLPGSTTLNSGLSRLSPQANSTYFPFGELSPFQKRGDADRMSIPERMGMSTEGMIASSLIRLQQIRDFSSQATHPVFPKSEPGSPEHKNYPLQKEYPPKEYT